MIPHSQKKSPIYFFLYIFRGMAVSLTMMLGRTGSIVGTNVAGLLLNAACEATFYTFGSLLIREYNFIQNLKEL